MPDNPRNGPTSEPAAVDTDVPETGAPETDASDTDVPETRAPEEPAGSDNVEEWDDVIELRRRWSFCVAATMAVAVGVAIQVHWVAAAPPYPEFWAWPLVPFILLTAVGTALVKLPVARRACGSWFATVCAILWVSATTAFILVIPGVSFAPIGIVFIVGSFVGFVLVVLTCLVLLYFSWRDAVTALVVLAMFIGLMFVSGDTLRRQGVRLRLGLVKDRYEEAIENGEVEASGGRTDGNYNGWLWFSDILDPVSGVIYDPYGNIDRLEEDGGGTDLLADPRMRPHRARVVLVQFPLMGNLSSRVNDQ